LIFSARLLLACPELSPPCSGSAFETHCRFFSPHFANELLVCFEVPLFMDGRQISSLFSSSFEAACLPTPSSRRPCGLSPPFPNDLSVRWRTWSNFFDPLRPSSYNFLFCVCALRPLRVFEFPPPFRFGVFYGCVFRGSIWILPYPLGLRKCLNFLSCPRSNARCFNPCPFSPCHKFFSIRGVISSCPGHGCSSHWRLANPLLFPLIPFSLSAGQTSFAFFQAPFSDHRNPPDFFFFFPFCPHLSFR